LGTRHNNPDVTSICTSCWVQSEAQKEENKRVRREAIAAAKVMNESVHVGHNAAINDGHHMPHCQAR
jgi:hypothetical protein